MSGSGTFAGTGYQAKVMAFVYVHMLTKSRLNWFSLEDDVPTAVLGETSGPGDDIGVQFAQIGPGVFCEIQAKHGLDQTEFNKAVAKVGECLARPGQLRPLGVVIAMDRNNSTNHLYSKVPEELERIRQGRRNDPTGPATTRILASEFGDTLVAQLRPIPLDVDSEHEPDAKTAIALLKAVLLEPDRASTAWALLVTDANDNCANRSQRSRHDLVQRLKLNGIHLRPEGAHEREFRIIRFAENLLRAGEHQTALAALEHIERQDWPAPMPNDLRFEFAMAKASALNHLLLPREALVMAKEAVALRPDSAPALARAAYAAQLTGLVEEARGLAAQAMAVDPESVRAWCAHAVIQGQDFDPTEAPAVVAAAVEFRTTLLGIAVGYGAWEVALERSDDLCAGGHNSADAMFLRSHIYYQVASTAPTQGAAEKWGQVRELATRALDLAEREGRHHRCALLAHRAGAAYAMGELADASADLDLALALNPNDAKILFQRALIHVNVGEHGHASQLLSHPVIASDVQGLTLRASLKAAAGDRAGANDDAITVERLLGQGNPIAHELLMFAQTAVHLEQVELANDVLARIDPRDLPKPELYWMLCADQAVRQRDASGAIAYIDRAIVAAPDQRTELLGNLASGLLAADCIDAAIGILRSLPLASLSPELRSNFCIALFIRGHYAELSKLIGVAFADADSRPPRILDIEVRLALLQDDAVTACTLLAKLTARGDVEPLAVLEYARLLAENDERDAALTVLGRLALHGLTAEVASLHARLLGELGDRARALCIAFEAYRRAPLSAEVCKNFITVAFFGAEASPLELLEVTADCYVRLRDCDDGDDHHVVLVSAGPVDPQRYEFAGDSEEAALYLGRRVGDHVVVGKSGWAPRRLAIEEILPAYVWSLRYLSQRFEQLFPNERFLRRFKIDTERELRAFVPLIECLAGAQERLELALRLYKGSPLPIGLLAVACNSTVPNVMSAITANRETAGPLGAEWADQNRDLALQTAATTRRIVLARSALWTLEYLDALELLDGFELHVPRALWREIHRELKELTQTLAAGSLTLHGGPLGIQSNHTAPDDPGVLRRVQFLQAVARHILDRGVVHPRPLALIGSREDDSSRLREHIGPDSYDALTLALHLGVPLYCDDLALRRLAIGGQLVAGFSTVALLEIRFEQSASAVQSGSNQLFNFIGRLAGVGYAAIVPTISMLDLATRAFAGQGQVERTAVLNLLATTPIPLALALAAEIIALRAADRIQLISTGNLARRLLTILPSEYPIAESCRALLQLLNRLIPLQPTVVLEADEACKQFVRPQSPWR